VKNEKEEKNDRDHLEICRRYENSKKLFNDIMDSKLFAKIKREEKLNQIL